MLDFDSEDIDGMDDDAGGEQEPLPRGHWTPTSSYDVYMVDTENDDEERKDAAKDCPLQKQSKQRHKRRPKSRLDRNNDHTDCHSLASSSIRVCIMFKFLLNLKWGRQKPPTPPGNN